MKKQKQENKKSKKLIKWIIIETLVAIGFLTTIILTILQSYNLMNSDPDNGIKTRALICSILACVSILPFGFLMWALIDEIKNYRKIKTKEKDNK